MAKVLVGQRRAGKSYILRQIASKLISEGVKSENILYINKEYMELATLQSAVEWEQAEIPTILQTNSWDIFFY